MALPPQRLVNGDLFIINRITANDEDTYKVNADDIGVFLLESDRSPGSQPGDKYVNDGEINIYGKLQNLSDDVINLHSANEHCEGKLTFDEGFYITGNAMDVLVTLDYATLTDELTCTNGGLDGSTTCIKLDMVWLSDNIVCGDKGLKSNGNCIGINLCEKHSGLTFRASGCLEVNLCNNRAIVYHPVNGCLDVDLNWLTNQLSCDGLRPSGGDATSTCMEIDMGWLSDNIRCGSTGNPSAYAGSGLVDGGGCIKVDPCWVNDQLNTSNPQYLISDYDATSIDTTNCKLRVNEAWLLKWAQDNIKEILIDDDALCLKIDGNKNLFKDDVVIKLPENCMKTWTEGVIDGKVKDIVGSTGIDVVGSPPNPNVAQGKVTLAVNEAYIQGLIDGSIALIPDPPTPGDGKLEIVAGSNIVIERVTGGDTFTANQTGNTKWQIKSTAGGGTGSPPTDACNNGGLIFDDSNNCLSVDWSKANDGKVTIKEGKNGIKISATNGNTHSANTDKDTEWTIDMDPASCPNYNEAVSANRVHLKESGGSGAPAIVLGTQASASGSCIPGKDGDNGVNNDGSCKYGIKAWLGINSNQQNGSFTCIRGIEGWKDFDDCGGKPDGATDKLFSVAAGTRVLPHHGTSGLVETNSGLAEDLRVFKYNQNPGDDDGFGMVGGKPKQGQYNRLSFRQVNFRRSDIQEIGRSTDSRIDLNIDDVIDKFGGFNDDPEVTNGIFRWGLKPLDEDKTHKYPFLFIDFQEVAERLPGFVDYTPNASAWEVYNSYNDDGELIDSDFVLKDDFDPATQLEPGAINWQAVHALAIAAIAKHKKRIAELEQKTTRAGTLNTLGIIEYANETAAANSGLGQGEVYWDTTLNRMRAVT